MRAAKLRSVEARARRDYRIPSLPLSICVSIFHSWNYKESDLILRNAAGSHSVSLSAELHEPSSINLSLIWLVFVRKEKEREREMEEERESLENTWWALGGPRECRWPSNE